MQLNIRNDKYKMRTTIILFHNVNKYNEIFLLVNNYDIIKGRYVYCNAILNICDRNIILNGLRKAENIKTV